MGALYIFFDLLKVLFTGLGSSVFMGIKFKRKMYIFCSSTSFDLLSAILFLVEVAFMTPSLSEVYRPTLCFVGFRCVIAFTGMVQRRLGLDDAGHLVAGSAKKRE